MTDTSPGSLGTTPDDDAGRRQAAAQIRQHPRWVVIWAALVARYRAWPMFRAPRDTSLTAQTPRELTAQMDEVERAARRLRQPQAHTDH